MAKFYLEDGTIASYDQLVANYYRDKLINQYYERRWRTMMEQSKNEFEGSTIKEPAVNGWNKVIVGTKYNSDGSPDMSNVSDGYHTFSELYKHRSILFAVLLQQLSDTWNSERVLEPWWSEKHQDGTMYDDMFVAGITDKNGNYVMSYHFEKEFKELFENSNIPKLERAPFYPGTNPEEELEALKNIVFDL